MTGNLCFAEMARIFALRWALEAMASLIAPLNWLSKWVVVVLSTVYLRCCQYSHFSRREWRYSPPTGHLAQSSDSSADTESAFSAELDLSEDISNPDLDFD